MTASALLRKLSAYPRQNGLAVALREAGRLERSIFMLNWLRDLDLRRRTQAGLNKGEARNALVRVIFFCRLGELRDRTFEKQAYRASGLNLRCRGCDPLEHALSRTLPPPISAWSPTRCATSRRSAGSTCRSPATTPGVPIPNRRRAS